MALVAACAPAASGVADRSTATGTVWLDTGEGLASLDVGEGSTGFTADRALPSPDLARLFTYGTGPAETTLTEVDAAGRELRSVSLPGGLEPAVVSGSGDKIALTTAGSRGNVWNPAARAVTRITVADVTAGDRRAYELEGNFEPEAFSTDGRRLYTIEYIPARAPTHYRVRILRLATGTVSPIGRLKSQAPGQMRGTGRMQVYAPGGEQLYTLYTQQGPNDLHGASGQSARDVNAFIHVLNLRFGWAHCVDLPQPFGSGDATASAIAVSPSGKNLFVTDWTNGAIAIVNPSKLKVMRTADVDLGGADDETFAAATEDRLYIGGEDEVVVVDAETVSVVARWRAGGEVEGLGFTSSGALAVATSDGVAVLDPRTGESAGEVPVDGVEAVLTAGTDV